MVERYGNLLGNIAGSKKEVITLPIKMPAVCEMKKSAKKNFILEKADRLVTEIPSASTIKVSLIKTVKKTASATKERAKVRGLAAGEIAAGGLVAKVAATAVASTGATGVVLAAAPWAAGFAAAALAGGIIKTVTDKNEENDNS